MKTGIIILFAALLAPFCGAIQPAQTSALFEDVEAPLPANRIDQFTYKKLKSAGITPTRCSDAVFLRRVYLDVIGKLPTQQEARDFLNDGDFDNKRTALIDDLLARDDFAIYNAMRWSDTLRIKAEFPINLWPNAAQAYYRWVRASLATHKPYDQFVREMLTSSGSNFRTGPVNFYRAIQNKTPQGIAEAVSLTFMGTRFESFSDEQQQGLITFFSQIGYKPTNEWKEENVFWDPLHVSKIAGNAAPGTAKVTTVLDESKVDQNPKMRDKPVAIAATLPDGTQLKLLPTRDPREVFADWLISEDNPWFARNAVNRTWAWLLGRGIVDEPDDFRADNPPSHPELLDWLAQQLVNHDYDMTQIFRLILMSNTYQAGPLLHSDAPDAAQLFASYPPRRIEAEVLIDAINTITGTTDLYTSAIPEPFTYLPTGLPAVAIADGSITSPFLALFGRSARATGLATERNNNIVPSQHLHLLNSSHIQTKLERGPGIKQFINNKREPIETINSLYLTILSRYPTPQEREIVMDYTQIELPERPWDKLIKDKTMTRAEKQLAKKKAKELDKGYRERLKELYAIRLANWGDIAWALINSPEFIYRH